jgi:hypothetical protein
MISDFRDPNDRISPASSIVLAELAFSAVRRRRIDPGKRHPQKRRPQVAAGGTDAAVSKPVESLKHLLWHGNVEKALERLGNLLTDLDPIRKRSAPARKPADGVAEFETHIRNRQEPIPNSGERCRRGETINTAFVESTINQVASGRFVKKQPMHWTPRGAHLPPRTRTKALNDELEGGFRRWRPLFRVQAQAA